MSKLHKGALGGGGGGSGAAGSKLGTLPFSQFEIRPYPLLLDQNLALCISPGFEFGPLHFT